MDQIVQYNNQNIVKNGGWTKQKGCTPNKYKR